MAKGKKDDCIYRVIKFEIHPNRKELLALGLVSVLLARLWNEALAERKNMFDTYLAPLYSKLKNASPEDARRIKGEIKAAWKDHKITLFDQINSLTPKRATDPEFACVPRNWQEETLDTLDGSFKSFMALRKKGDKDARPPYLRREDDFCEIPGRYGFKVEGQHIILSLRNIAPDLPFKYEIPEYQQQKLSESKRSKKFTLYRTVDPVNGNVRFWISLALELDKPAQTEFNPEEAIYLSLGASSVGVISPYGEMVIRLWRPDKYWKSRIEEAYRATTTATRGSTAPKKGSNRWKKRHGAFRRMNQLMARQRKQHVRDTVSSLLKLGKHFVVTDYVIRSKAGRLADGTNPERGGAPQGLNWSAQNAGMIADLVAQLQVKVSDCGGSVRKHTLNLSPDEIPPGHGHHNKVQMARLLRKSFLQTVELV